ncbi:hcp [Symbiodinium microadriaticum]|nr:hcp [Symbiodinium microadriaticum]CAE7889655.1 hcp [Symbiodinium sp. KB8]
MVVWAVQKPWLKQNLPYRAAHFPAFPGLGGLGGNPWQQQRRPPPTVPADFQVDSNARHFGTCVYYHKWRGYGFLEPTHVGTVPTNKVFVHWKQLTSDDRFPFLVKGMEVEFSLMVSKDFHRGLNTLRAKNVTLVGGESIALQDELDATEKQFVGGQHLRYTGTLKFYSPRHGFGYVMMDEGYDVEASVPLELRVDHEEVNAAGQQPVHMRDIAVEFGIYRTDRGQYKVYNMTLQGGHPLTQDALENRISMGMGMYRGQIAFWNWRQGYGFIRPDPTAILPEKVVARLVEQAEAARKRGKRIAEDSLLYFRRPDVTPMLIPQQGMQAERFLCPELAASGSILQRNSRRTANMLFFFSGA